MKGFSEKQKVAFWSILSGFAVSVFAFLFMQEVFTGVNAFSISVTAIVVTLSAYPIYCFVSSNKQKVEQWFA
jgi:hypothetical protein